MLNLTLVSHSVLPKPRPNRTIGLLLTHEKQVRCSLAIGQLHVCRMGFDLAPRFVIGTCAQCCQHRCYWATFDPVLTTKNCEKRVRRGLAKDQLHVSLWALIWRLVLHGLANFFVGNTGLIGWPMVASSGRRSFYTLFRNGQ